MNDRFSRLLRVFLAEPGWGGEGLHLMSIPEAGFLAGAIVLGAGAPSGTWIHHARA